MNLVLAAACFVLLTFWMLRRRNRIGSTSLSLEQDQTTDS